MPQSYDYDVIVIGAGSGGLSSSIALSTVGKKVLLIEKALMGGECTNTGCIPSKNLIHHAHEYHRAKVKAGETDLLKAYHSNIFHLVRKKVHMVREEESVEVLEKEHGIQVLLGKASFVDDHTVQIEGKEETVKHTAKRIVIATGSSARRMDIKGLDHDALLTNENIFDLRGIPQRMVVVGAGAIGCELGQALALLGCEVTFLNRSQRLLPREEPEVSTHIQELFEQQGITVINNCVITHADGPFVLAEEKRGDDTLLHKVPFEKVLLGIGRVPNVDGLNLEAAGIKYSTSGIGVDKHYRTNKKHIFAVGDVSSAAKFTHVADDQGRHLMKKLSIPFYPAQNNKPLPRVTFLSEEVASVGMSFAETKEKYGEESVVKIQIPYGNTDRANTDEAQSGIAMVFAKKLTGRIVGASLVGKQSGELISVFTLAIQNKISLYRLNTMIVPYPVLGRLYKKLSDAYIGYTLQHLKPDLKQALKRSLPFFLLGILLVAGGAVLLWKLVVQ